MDICLISENAICLISKKRFEMYIVLHCLVKNAHVKLLEITTISSFAVPDCTNMQLQNIDPK